MTRGFIQIAGFTFGKATSFFDFVSTAAAAYNAGMVHSSDTGDAGHIVAAYTAQFGNGLSATLSSRTDPPARRPTFLEPVGAQFSLASLTGASSTTKRIWRVTHGTNLRRRPAGYRRQPPHRPGLGFCPGAGALHMTSAPATSAVSRYAHRVTGHPINPWGFAVTAGLRLNAPMIGPGDYFQARRIYSEGATGYLSQTPSGAAWNKWDGNTLRLRVLD